MPREIADSDDEVEFAPPPPRGSKDIGQQEAAPPSTAERDAQDPMLNLDFDTFLSPTQRISSFDGNQDTSNEVDASNVLDSSTDRFLNEVAPAPSSIAPAESHIDGGSGDMSMGGKITKKEKTSKKRSRTQHDDGTSSRDNGSARKRTKTYTGAASSGMSSAQMEFQALINSNDNHNTPRQDHSGAKDYADTIDPADMVSIEERTQYTEPLDLSLGLSASNDNLDNAQAEAKNLNPVQMQPYTPHQPYTPQTSFFGANLQGGTTSRSSMGNYQSFTIDPSALNMDYNKINPFGSLTQASFDGDADTEETRALAGIFRQSASGSNGMSNGSGADAEMLMNNMQEMQTSPEKGASSVDAPEQLVAQEEPPQGSPPFSPITNPDDENPSLETVPSHDLDQTAALESQHVEKVEELIKPPPKKRGRKPKQKKQDDGVVNEENNVDELQPEEPHTARATRAGTVDSVSNVSEISQATTSSKTGRKRKGKKADMAPPEVLSKKLPSSDLGLNNKEVIGLSPERYVPRPSKRRGRAEPEPTPEAATAQQDEASKPTASQEVPDKATPAKGKKGKKAKVKRAKTSAAALLGKSADFLDDDEKEEAKEVMFVDERPAKVKFQPLPELSPDRKLKKEQLAETPVEADEEDEEVLKSGKRNAKITIDVPVLAKSDDHEELPPPVPEPKKRGRKRKKVVEEPAEEPIEAPVAVEDEQDEERPALAEKDGNAPNKKAKGAHSSQNTKAIDDEEEATDKENNTGKTPDVVPEVSTPTKSVSTPVSKPAHSPLKPPSSTTPLFNARTRIGLSKRHSIPSLLRKVDRNKQAPKAIEKKEKMNKARREEIEQERIAREEADAEGREYVPPDLMRGKDGLLVEWDF
ncbi:hypothetical protein OHC33_003055 [Knufia fluminis]|uniref:Uncharacterized protein n=1 Tax=Knufia fluminis TaxID=191047 RepID=A0AAN8IPU9_9EURO|nr:hypothetical protein OHC33_003055 [Knufia fluminis]